MKRKTCLWGKFCFLEKKKKDTNFVSYEQANKEAETLYICLYSEPPTYKRLKGSRGHKHVILEASMVLLSIQATKKKSLICVYYQHYDNTENTEVCHLPRVRGFCSALLNICLHRVLLL